MDTSKNPLPTEPVVQQTVGYQPVVANPHGVNNGAQAPKVVNQPVYGAVLEKKRGLKSFFAKNKPDENRDETLNAASVLSNSSAHKISKKRLALAALMVLITVTGGILGYNILKSKDTKSFNPAAQTIDPASLPEQEEKVVEQNYFIEGSLRVTGASNIVGELNVTSNIATSGQFVGNGAGLSNVNASLLNGQPGAYYLDATNISAGTLSVDRGGTGRSSLDLNGVVIGSGTGALNVAANGASGQCFMANLTGPPSFQSCPGRNVVLSLNGLSGSLNIANASGAGSTITLNNASTSQKGIAQFNAVNFSSSSGTINTIQDIATSSSPTFNDLFISGNLGIGDVSPTARLSLGGTGSSNGIVLGDDISGSVNLYRSDSNALKTDDVLRVGSDLFLEDSAVLYFDTAGEVSLFKNGLSTLQTNDKLVVGDTLSVQGSGDSSFAGQLGIGTSSPAQSLHVKTTSGNTVIRLDAEGQASSSNGPNSASAGANQAGVGSQAWTNPGNITTSDDVAATVSNSSNYLVSSSHGFALPISATITGIKVEIRNRDNVFSGGFFDNEVKLVKGGTIGGTNKASASYWPETFAYASYGGSSDLWGQTWTPSDINSSNFGVAVAAARDDPGTASVDHIRITVYYTDSGTISWSTGIDTADSDSFKVSGSSSLGTNDFFEISKTGAVIFKNAENSTSGFNVQNSAGSSVLNIDTTNKRVGIGTTSPGAELEVVASGGGKVQLTGSAGNASILFNSSSVSIQTTGSSQENLSYNANTGGYHGFGISSTEKARIDTTGLTVSGEGLFRSDSASAFRVQNASGTTTYFGVDTNSGILFSGIADSGSAVGFTLNTSVAYTASGAKLLSVKNSGTERFAIDKDGRIITNTPELSCSAGASAGSSPSVVVSGNDTAGYIDITAGSGATTGQLIDCSFDNPRTSSPTVLLTEGTEDAVIPRVYVKNVDSNGFEVWSAATPDPGFVLRYYFWAVQY